MADKTISNKAYSPFKTAICDFLRERCRREPEFVKKVKNPNKNIDKCLDYIIGEVKQSGRSGFADDEIFSLAVHYYDESNDMLVEHKHIDSVKVIVNREMPFTEEEKQKARQDAYDKLVHENLNRMKGNTKTTMTIKKEEDSTKPQQLSLF